MISSKLSLSIVEKKLNLFTVLPFRRISENSGVGALGVVLRRYDLPLASFLSYDDVVDEDMILL